MSSNSRNVKFLQQISNGYNNKFKFHPQFFLYFSQEAEVLLCLFNNSKEVPHQISTIDSGMPFIVTQKLINLLNC